MDQANFINQSLALTLVITISLIFIFLGLIYSKRYRGINNYLIANRNINFFSLSTSFIASALGAWILFGPPAAATWGGLGSIIGYALGTAFPMIALIYLGKKIRKDFPKGSKVQLLLQPEDLEHDDKSNLKLEVKDKVPIFLPAVR